MFGKILKKDFKSLARQKRGLTLALIPFALAILAIIYTILMYIITKYISIDTSGFGEAFNFGMNYVSSIGMFGAFFLTYGLIILAIISGNLVAGEIKNKQWVLPMNAGHKPRELFLSKLLASEIWVFASCFVGCLIHFLFTVIFCKAEGMMVWQLLENYLFYVLTIALYINVIISLNFITKKSWIGIVVTILSVIFFPSIFASVKIGSQSLVGYTPLFVLSSDGVSPLAMGKPNFFAVLTTGQWISATIIYLLIFIGLPLWAMLSSKIKASK